MLTPAEVGYVLGDCRAVALPTSAAQLGPMRELAASLPGVRLVLGLDTDPADGADDAFAGLFDTPPLVDPPPVDPAALSTIGYTSGTTGHPKGAMQSQQAVLLNCALTATMHGRTAGDTVVTALPAPHVYGNVAINGTFLAGGTVVLMERFDAGQTLKLIAEHCATMFEGVPAMYSMLLASDSLDGAELDSLRVCTVGGQTISTAVVDAWQRRSGAPLLELWGMTEVAGPGTTHAVYAPPVPGSIGVSLPGIEIRVADLGDVAVTPPPGTPGELMVRGPIVMIERVLAAHPAVAMVAVGPVADEVKGEVACAYVVRRPGAQPTEAELIDFTRNQLAAYKRPRRVVFVESLPATSTGKIMRRKLTEAVPAG